MYNGVLGCERTSAPSTQPRRARHYRCVYDDAAATCSMTDDGGLLAVAGHAAAVVVWTPPPPPRRRRRRPHHRRHRRRVPRPQARRRAAREHAAVESIATGRRRADGVVGVGAAARRTRRSWRCPRRRAARPAAPCGRAAREPHRPIAVTVRTAGANARRRRRRAAAVEAKVAGGSAPHERRAAAPANLGELDPDDEPTAMATDWRCTAAAACQLCRRRRRHRRGRRSRLRRRPRSATAREHARRRRMVHLLTDVAKGCGARRSTSRRRQPGARREHLLGLRRLAAVADAPAGGRGDQRRRHI